MKNQLVIEAERFRVFRKAEGLSLEELAEILGKKNHSTISKYESGTYNIPIGVVKTMHMKLQMSYEWFFHGKGNRKYTAEKTNLVTDIKSYENAQALISNRVDAIERTLNKLVRDFYADLHTKNGRKTDTART